MTQPTARRDLAWQASLFGGAEASFDVEFSTVQRLDLDATAWVDHAPGWVAGGDTLFETLLTAAPWEEHKVWMYERKVEQPRLTARWDERPAMLDDMRTALSGWYGVEFTSVGFNLYRDGRDSVAWHGDRVARELPEAIVAIVSLGGRRRFQLRPKGGGLSTTIWVASGDVLVMGGSCQRTWDHSVPKMRTAEPRISVTFRHAYDGRG
ncbi:MAG: alpha-ketoglutarate-dependent dioxygenase AlkB family protein [Acidimicrobiales bacterium]